jgi:hypothetical protein
MIHHNLQLVNSDDTQYLMPHSPSIMKYACATQPLILSLAFEHWSLTPFTIW